MRSRAERKALTTADMPSGQVQSHTASMCEFPIMWNLYWLAVEGQGSVAGNFADWAPAFNAGKTMVIMSTQILDDRSPGPFMTVFLSTDLHTRSSQLAGRSSSPPIPP